MVVPYPRMPRNRFGRWLWLGLSCGIILVFLALSVSLIVFTLAPADPADRPIGGELILSIAILLAFLLGAALFAWILADGLRTVARERAERRSLEARAREARARIAHLRGRRR